MLAHLGWVLATGTSGGLKYSCVKTYSGYSAWWLVLLHSQRALLSAVGIAIIVHK